MELIDLYNSIQNPIDDPVVIEKLIQAYAKSSNIKNGFYTQLLSSAFKEQTKGQYYQEDYDKFHSLMFNKWKNSITSMTKEEFLELYHNGSYGQDFVEMRNYLLNIPDVSTAKEVNNVFFNKKSSKTLEEALYKYRWNAFGANPDWTHVYSRYVTAKKDPHINVENRLYLNTESMDTYKMANLFVKKCDTHHLPYYFKFNPTGDRDDTIVIYSSTKDLTKYLGILNEIKKENPELVSRIKPAPVLTGKIDDWIGYGSEPKPAPDGSLQSFNDVRSKPIESAIDELTKKWVMSHKDDQITSHGQKTSFQNYISLKSTESFISRLKDQYQYQYNYEIKHTGFNGQAYKQSSTIDALEYSLKDLESPKLKQYIYNVISKNMTVDLTKVCSTWHGYENMPPIIIKCRNNKLISFTGNDLEKVIQSLSVAISEHDNQFITLVQEKIKMNSRNRGIDLNKYCFDTRITEQIKSMSATQEVSEDNGFKR